MQTHALACTWMYKPRQRIARFLRVPKRQTQKSARQLIKNSYLKRIGRRSEVSAMQESAILLLQSESIDAQWFRIALQSAADPCADNEAAA